MTLIASTASPYKFPRVVVEAITDQMVLDDFETVEKLNPLSQVMQPKVVVGLQEPAIRHSLLVKTKEMQTAVEDYLDL